jgi:hypothetical protein
MFNACALAAMVFLVGCSAKKPVTMTVPGTSIPVVVPKLEEKGCLADPEGLMKKSDRKIIRKVCLGTKRTLGLKPILSIRKTTPSEIFQAMDFESSKTAGQLIAVYGSTWKEGMYGKGDSVLLHINVATRGLSLSAPRHMESQINKDLNVLGLAQKEFYRARRLSIENPSKHHSSEFFGYMALFMTLLPVFEETFTPPPRK